MGEGRILHTLLLLKSLSAFETLIEAPLSDWSLHTEQATHLRSRAEEDQTQGCIHPTLSLLPEQFLQPLFAFRVPKIQHAAIFESLCFIAQKLEPGMLLI